MYQPRIYAHGPPNNDKTGAIVRTAQRPIYIINSPGETGYGTIPTDDPEIVCHPLFDPNESSAKLLKGVQEAVTLAIKAGTYRTIAFEGLHNLQDYVMDMLMNGDYFKGEKPEWSAFGLNYHWMDLFISKLMVNNVHQVIFTGWSKEKGERKPRKGEKMEDIPQSIGPSMLGEYSRTVIGRIPFVFHQTLRPRKDANGQPVRDKKEDRVIYDSMWQTRPYGLVKGVGMKGPAAIIKEIPLFIPADYSHLETLWKEHA